MRRTSNPSRDTNGLHRCGAADRSPARSAGSWGPSTTRAAGSWIWTEDRTPRALDSAGFPAFLTRSTRPHWASTATDARPGTGRAAGVRRASSGRDGKSHGFRVCECSSQSRRGSRDQDTQEKEIAR